MTQTLRNLLNLENVLLLGFSILIWAIAIVALNRQTHHLIDVLDRRHTQHRKAALDSIRAERDVTVRRLQVQIDSLRSLHQ